MKEAVHSFFMTPGYGGLLVTLVVVVLVTTYVSLVFWIRRGAEQVADDDA